MDGHEPNPHGQFIKLPEAEFVTDVKEAEVDELKFPIIDPLLLELETVIVQDTVTEDKVRKPPLITEMIPPTLKLEAIVPETVTLVIVIAFVVE